jgi:hypothetical protein
MFIAIVGADRRAKGSLGGRLLATTGLVWVLILVQSNAPGTLAQGLFVFDNYVYDRGKPIIDEPIHVLDRATGACIRPFGDDWHAELLGSVPARGVSLTPLSPILEFAPPFGPGYLGKVLEVPGTVSGDIAEVYIRAFQGPDFDTAGVRAVAGPFTVQLVMPPGTPNYVSLPPGSLDMCIPEPGTIALLAAGMAALGLARRQTRPFPGRQRAFRGRGGDLGADPSVKEDRNRAG